MSFWSNMILDFFVAFGIVVGGSILGGVGAVIGHHPELTPFKIMENLAGQLKFWALIAALGGTIDILRLVETNLYDGHFSIVLQQVLYLLSCFAGAHIGFLLINWLVGGDIT